MEERTVSNARRIEDLTVELRKLTDRNVTKNKEIKKMQDLVSTLCIRTMHYLSVHSNCVDSTYCMYVLQINLNEEKCPLHHFRM